MNSAKAKRGGNNRWPATFGRSRSKFPTNHASSRDFKDWGRGQQVVDQGKPQTPSGPTIQSPLASLLGNVAQVFLTDGVVIEGVLTSVSADLELSLSACVKESVETFKEDQDESSTATVRKDLIPQLSIEFADVVNIRISSKNLSISSNEFQVDSVISEFAGDVKERKLTPWEPSQDDSALTSIEDGLNHAGGPNGWAVEDMLHVNTKKFGVKSTFDSSMSSYMTPIDKDNPQYEKMQREAARIAREMEGAAAYKENDNFDSGVGEEEAFSAVQRSGSQRDPMPSLSRGKSMRPQVNRPGMGREMGTSAAGPGGREQPKGVFNSVKKNGLAGSPAPPAMQLSYSDKVKRSTGHDQMPLSNRSDPLMPVAEVPVSSPDPAVTVQQSVLLKERNSIDHGVLTEGGKELFTKSKTTYSKYGREVPASKNTDDGNRSDLNDLKNFQSIQIQPGHDSKSDSKALKRDSHSLKREDRSNKDPVSKSASPYGGSSTISTTTSSHTTATAAKGKSDEAINDQSEPQHDSKPSTESVSRSSPAKQLESGQVPDPETRSIAKISTLNPNAKEFRLNPNAPEFVPGPSRAQAAQPAPAMQAMSPMLPQQQLQPELAAYQMQPQHMQLSSQQQQQQQIAIHQQQQQQQQQFYSPHPVVIQPDQQRHPGQARKPPRPMGQAQVVFSAGPDYSGVPTATMAPFYSQVVPQVPGGGMPIQAQGVPQQTYGEGRPVFVVPQSPGPHPYAPMGGGPMIFPVAQQAMQPNLPPGSMAVRNPGNPQQVPNGQFIRYGGMQMVGSMPAIPSSQAYVPGQAMQNFSPMN